MWGRRSTRCSNTSPPPRNTSAPTPSCSTPPCPGHYGGTGAKLDWHALRGELDRVGDRLPPVILAGGLTPENVAEAVKIVRPWGVDVAGGVESSPGIKDPAKVRAFVENARAAAAG